MDKTDVKRIRQILGLTQKELADKIGVSVNTIQNYEKGGVIPTSRQQILITLEELAMSKIKIGTVMDITNDSGNINTGTVGGHNVNIASSDYEKIIEKDHIELTRKGAESRERLQEISSLKAEIRRLEAVVDSKDETIKALKELVNTLKGI